jgi:site-specific DNA-methyltransferase (adenine-specific)
MTTPYHAANGVTIYCADNRAVSWPDADLVLTDPPYSAVTHDGARTSADWDVTGGNEAPALGIDFAPLAPADVDALFTQIGTIAKRWVVSFLDWRHIAHLDANPPNGLRFVRFGVWVKPNGAPQFTGDRPGTGWESLAILHRSGVKMQWNGGGRNSVWTYPVAHHQHRISDHPNAKPIPLLVELLDLFSAKGDLVFDPFGGSGAVAAACYLTGRRCVIIEQDDRYCADLVYYLSHHRPRRGVSGDVLPMFEGTDL